MPDYLDKFTEKKKDGTLIQSVPIRDSDAQERLATVEEKLTTDTTSASGNPLSIVGLKSTQNAINPIVTLEPIQDLHGQDKPYPAGGGKNKFNATEAFTNCTLSDGIYTVTSVPSSAVGSNLGQIYLEAGNYIINGGHSDALRCYITIDGTNYTTRGTDVSFTVSTAGTYNVNGVITTEITVGAKMKPMIRLATETDATFAPYSNICPISGYDKIEVLSCGANLWDEEWRLGNYSDADGSWGTGQSYVCNTNPIKVMPNTSYCSVGTNRVFYYKANGEYISHSNNFSGEFTTPENCAYINIRTSQQTTYGGGNGINYPSSATTYSPYHKTTDLSENLPQTVYGGSLDLNSGVLTVDRVFNSDLSQLTWNKRTTVTNKWEFYAQLNTMKTPTSGSYLADMKCSIYKVITADQAYNGNNGLGIAAGIYSGNASLYVYDDTISELTDFQNAMDGVQLVYELATPIEIQLTPTELTLLKDYAYVSTNGTRIDLDYRNGEMATLEDVKELKDYVDSRLADGGHNYSTTEQVVGTWIDGKTIYEKTWDFGSNQSFNSQSWTDTPIKVSDYLMEKLISISGINNSGAIYNFLAANTDQTYVQILQTRNTSVSIRYLILQYTKTTN